MYQKLYMSSVLLMSLFVTHTSLTKDVESNKKINRKVEFKYKTSYGDVSREFVADLVGHISSYLSDLGKNFKKHPYVLSTVIATAIPAVLYKDEVQKHLSQFVYGNGKDLKDHRLEVTAAVWTCLAAACLTHDKWAKYFPANRDGDDAGFEAEKE